MAGFPPDSYSTPGSGWPPVAPTAAGVVVTTSTTARPTIVRRTTCSGAGEAARRLARALLGPDAPQPEPRQLREPPGELLGVVRRVGVGEGVAAGRLGDADERVREHAPVLVGAVDLDEGR